MNTEKLKALFEKSENKYADAEAIGTTYQTMNNIIYKGSVCKVDLIKRIADFYGVPVGYFFDDGEEEGREETEAEKEERLRQERMSQMERMEMIRYKEEMEKKKDVILERLNYVILKKRMSITAFSKCVGMVQTTVNRQLTGKSQLSCELIEAFLRVFPDISSEWLLRGEGAVTIENSQTIDGEQKKGSVPYYGYLPVSAGKNELAEILSRESPTGWIKLPGITDAIGAFPVVGCSMEPFIQAGDFVAISPLNKWERLDPDKVYMIITQEDRMIKHLYNDLDDPEILWCVSPNYPKFKLHKDEIKAIYRITFHGRIM